MNASGKTETKILSFSHDYGTFKSIKLAALTLSAYHSCPYEDTDDDIKAEADACMERIKRQKEAERK